MHTRISFSFVFLFFLLFGLSSCSSIKTINNEILVEYFTLADSYASVKKYDKAILFYKKSLQHPDYTRASEWGLVRMYALQNKWDEAQTILKPIFEENQNNIFIASAYAYLLVQKNQAEDGLDLYKQLYEENSDNSDFGYNYLLLLYSAKKYEEALSLSLLLQETFPYDTLLYSFKDIEKKAEEKTTPVESSEEDPPTDPIENQ